jgi:hypothetical protein
MADGIARVVETWIARWARYGGRAAPEAEHGPVRATAARHRTPRTWPLLTTATRRVPAPHGDALPVHRDGTHGSAARAGRP